MIGLLLLAIFLFPTFANAAEPRDVIINEINWAGSSASTADEWLEIKNLTDGAVDLSGWKIEGAATSGGTLTIPSGSMLPAQGFFLISNFAHTDSHSTLNVPADWVTTSVSLRNSNAKYWLVDPFGNTIDVADDGAGNPLAGDNTTKASMERNRQILRGDGQQSWHTAYLSTNFDSGVSQFGAPKAENNALPNVSFGRVSPATTPSGQPNSFSVDYELSDPDGLGDIVSAKIDLTDIGGNVFDLDIQSVYAKYVIAPPLVGTRAWKITITDSIGGTAVVTNQLTVFQDAAQVGISEVLPRPEQGSDFEWIELHNGSSHPINLGGFLLDDIPDGGSKPYTFPVGFTIEAGGFLVIEKSSHKLALNDDGDIVQLVGPDGVVVSKTPDWGNAKKSESFALVGGTWQWTTVLTKGEPNQPTPGVAETPPTTPNPSPATPVPDVEPVTTPGVEPVASSAAQPVSVPVSASEQSPPIVRPSKKLVKGVRVTSTTKPVTKPEHSAKLPIVATGLIVVQEVLTWLRKRRVPSKPSIRIVNETTRRITY